MADDEVVEPQAGELTTANYGWTKPTVGASDDAWGGYLNSDLDGIDTTVKSVSNVANAAYPASNPSGYQTAANVTTSLAPYALTASVPVASTAAPIMDSVAAVGTGTTWARADHVHPLAFQVIGDNRIINGDMRIDQRGVASGAGGTAVGYTVDRWQFSATLATKGSWLRANFGALGFPYALAFSSNSAYTPLAGDTFCFIQPIEADMISDFQWGTAQAQPVTLSFVVLSTLTGTFSGAIQNAANTRSYPFTYSIPTASAATKISITVPGDTTGAWVLSGNVRSLSVIFDLGTGATYRAPAGAWAGAQYNGANGAVNVVATNGATFYLTGVKLEVGSVATPFNRQSLAKSLADCQRYYQVGQMINNSYGGAASVVYCSGNLPASMRASPTIAIVSTVLSNATAQGAGSYNSTSLYFNVTVTVLGATQFGCTYTASAEL